MTEKQEIKKWQENQKLFKQGYKPLPENSRPWASYTVRAEELPPEESLRIARMINPDYQPIEEAPEQPSREELDAIAALINADTQAILKHPDMRPEQAMERERFLREH